MTLLKPKTSFYSQIPIVQMQLNETNDTLCSHRWTNKISILFFRLLQLRLPPFARPANESWTEVWSNMPHIHRANWLFFIRSVHHEFPIGSCVKRRRNEPATHGASSHSVMKLPHNSFVDWCRCWLLCNFFLCCCLFLGHLWSQGARHTSELMARTRCWKYILGVCVCMTSQGRASDKGSCCRMHAQHCQCSHISSQIN